MTILRLFLSFLKIGAVSFGGGYGMIPLIREEVLANQWLTEAEFIDFIAVSESTPGPLAVNMATFIGASQGGIIGALAATLGVILPSFIIILLIAAILKNLLKYKGVNAFLGGIRPVIAGLITATALTMLLSLVSGVKQIGDTPTFEWRQTLIFVIIAAVALIFKALRKKKISPIILIIISAGLGIVFYI